MNKTYGLVSVTFRKKTAEEIVKLCIQAKLSAIEWGGDIHVPSGNLEAARRVKALTEESGLTTTCYGSYFRLLEHSPEGFESAAETAAVLGAPKIRIWGGSKSCEDMSHSEKEKLFEECERILQIAKNYGVNVYLECHRNSFTQTKEGASELFKVFAENGLLSHWQPNPELSVDENINYINSLPFVNSVHVFEWEEHDGKPRIMHPLCKGADTWNKYVSALEKKAVGEKLELMLEFVRDESEKSFFEDAKILKAL